MTLRIYIGYDDRQVISYTVLQGSIVCQASQPVAIVPLSLPTLPIKRVGLTPFTFSRFLVPWLQDYRGWALFMDADILVLADIAQLFALADDSFAVMVVQNPRRFEWASVILFNCGHPANKALTPAYVDDPKAPLFKFGWLKNHDIGDLPREWNHLVGYDKPRPDAKLVHYTMGIPPFEETRMCEYADHWMRAHKLVNATAPWAQLMGNSVHCSQHPDGRLLPHFHPDIVALKKEVA